MKLVSMLLKHALDLCISLLHVSNQSLNFSDKLKMTRVTLLFKEGSNSELVNYRSISALPCFSKILEKIKYNCLYNHLQENDIFYKK